MQCIYVLCGKGAICLRKYCQRVKLLKTVTLNGHRISNPGAVERMPEAQLFFQCVRTLSLRSTKVLYRHLVRTIGSGCFLSKLRLLGTSVVFGEGILYCRGKEMQNQPSTVTATAKSVCVKPAFKLVHVNKIHKQDSFPRTVY